MIPRNKTLAARIARAAVSLTVAVAMTGVPAAWAQPTPNNAAAPAAAAGGDAAAKRAALEAELTESFAKFDKAARQFPRESFDPQALLEVVGRDPAKLFEWVRDRTAYAPYRGALRGADGTLMDGSGNALDRSLLLAELLRASGHKVRLARGELTDAQAEAVLKSGLRAPPAAAQAAAADRAKADEVARLAGVNANDLAASLTASAAVTTAVLNEVRSATAEQSALVLQAAGPLRAPKGDADEAARRLAAAKDHWWVQRQEAGKWIDLDPALPNAVAGKALAAAPTTTVDVPDEGAPKLPAGEAHEVRVRLVIERSDAGKLTESVALDQTLRTHELGGRSATILHVPLRGPGEIDLDAAKDPADTLRKSVAAHSQWLPVLAVGRKYEATKAFDDSGTLIDNPKLDRTAGVSGKVGGTFGGLGGGLDGSGGGEQKAAGTLSAEWVEYTIKSPGRPDATIRRALFDLVGPAARGAGKALAAAPTGAQGVERNLMLAGRVDVLLVAGRVTPEYVASLQVDQLQAAKKAVAAAVAANKAAAGKPAADRAKASSAAAGDIVAELRMPSVLYALQLFRQQASPAPERVYIDRPNVLNHRLSLAVTPDNRVAVRRAIDISYNPVAVRPAPGAATAGDAFAIRVRQGVADTAIEGALLGKSETTIENTVVLFARAKDAGAPTLARAAADVPASAAKVPADAKARLAQSLAEGYAAVLPGASVATAGGERYGWYRVDPATGDTIGVMDAGLHQTATENAVVRALGRVQEAAGKSVILGASAMFEAQTLTQFLAIMGIGANASPAVLYRAALLFAQVQQYIAMLNGR